MASDPIRPSLRAGDLEARVDDVLDRLAARAAHKGLQAVSTAHLRDDVVALVRCAIAAEALDRALGRRRRVARQWRRESPEKLKAAPLRV